MHLDKDSLREGWGGRVNKDCRAKVLQISILQKMSNLCSKSANCYPKHLIVDPEGGVGGGV